MFEVVEKLGEGSYSTVFKVKRKSDGKIYALKQVRLTLLKPKEKENALTEIRVLASIAHPNVIAYKQAFIDSTKNVLNLVMEYADDGDLLQRINSHKKKKTMFSEGEIWDYFIQTVRGLKSLHDLKIVHRDMKCANLFLTKAGSLKIGDLNVSKVAKKGLVYTQTGTPYYASPEVWRDSPYDFKSDIWSLGCVLYEMCALEPPFRANDMKSLYRKVIRGEYPPIPKLYSSGLSEVIRSLLKVNPLQRPSCGQILDLSIVKTHSFSALEEESPNCLLRTIHMPNQINNLDKHLPAPAYEKQPDVPYKRINSEQILQKKSFDPLRAYHDLKKYGLQCVASRNGLQSKVAVSRKENERKWNRPVVKPVWWG